MTTKFHCPHCRRESDYEDMQLDEDLHAIIKMLATFRQHHNLVMAYTELFGLAPLKTKRKKWRLLLEELKRLFDSESFTFQKRAYRISQAGIVEALGLVAKKNFAEPLENHNYLKKIMISIAEASAKTAGATAEKDLRKKEERLMSGTRDAYPLPEERVLPEGTHYAPKSMPAAHLTEAQIVENKRKVRELMKTIGGLDEK